MHEPTRERLLADSLTAGPRKRLDQITLQVTGLQQLSRPLITH